MSTVASCAFVGLIHRRKTFPCRSLSQKRRSKNNLCPMASSKPPNEQVNWPSGNAWLKLGKGRTNSSRQALVAQKAVSLNQRKPLAARVARGHGRG